jgi:carbon-monoxide dehydrogenase small subunit
MSIKVSMMVNGKGMTHDIHDHTLLVYYIREHIGLTGTHVGCDTAQCGACTVLRDGHAVKSCNQLAAMAQDCHITTIEGVAGANGQLHPLQEAFRRCHGLQCGYCTPGMVMSALDLLKHHPHPSEDEIAEHLDGNLCRCTGYYNIVKAIHAASQVMSD